MREHALLLLQQALGNPKADFVDGQWEAIEAVLNPGRRALVVQRTGWGKSMVYFLGTKIKREQGLGPTLVLSPLLALMRDQLANAERLGLRAATLNSSQETAESAEVINALKADNVDLLLISPEQLTSARFRDLIASTSIGRAGLVVIDEAHCVSDWGHDFRPDFRRISRLVRNLPPSTSVLATTATANERVVNDLRDVLGHHAVVLRGPLARESLRLQVLPPSHAAERLAWLAEVLPTLPGSGIIYTLTQRDADRVSKWLNTQGINAPAYHSGLKTQRPLLEEALKGNQVKALVATLALGMGFDKPDLGFVVHFQSPANLVAYYQQIGRAGRSIPDAIAVLMAGTEDDSILGYFASQAFPLEKMRAVVTALNESGPMKSSELGSATNIGKKKIDSILKFLQCEDPVAVVQIEGQFALAPEGRIDEARIAGVQRRKVEERNEILAFMRGAGCLMESVARALDDPAAKPCGRCAVCLGTSLVPLRAQDTTIQAALQFLNHDRPEIQPRQKWTVPLPGYGWKGNISQNLQCERGFCLCYYGDPGVARKVSEGANQNHYSHDVVVLAAEAVREKWPEFPFSCLTWVPSQRASHPIPAFARELANLLGIPAVELVRKVKRTPPQKSMRNASRQALNLEDAFEVVGTPTGAVLLVDDVCYSRWSFTIVGALLRQAGTAAVFPFALASASSGVDES